MSNLEEDLGGILEEYVEAVNADGLTEGLKEEFAEEVITVITDYDYFHIDEINDIMADKEPMRNEGIFNGNY